MTLAHFKKSWSGREQRMEANMPVFNFSVWLLEKMRIWSMIGHNICGRTADEEWWWEGGLERPHHQDHHNHHMEIYKCMDFICLPNILPNTAYYMATWEFTRLLVTSRGLYFSSNNTRLNLIIPQAFLHAYGKLYLRCDMILHQEMTATIAALEMRWWYWFFSFSS